MTASDSVLLARFVLTRARAAGLDPVELARAAGIGAGALDGPPGSIPGQCYPRLWELFERRAELPHVGLRAAERYGMGELGMMDYLLATASTVGEGFRAAGEFGSALSTTRRVAVVGEDDRHVTFAAETAGEGRAAVLRRAATAATLSTPPARAWADLLAAELDSLPSLDTASIHGMARRLDTSPRTLQRRLAAAGTSWSRELASARRRAAW
ncbi:AraC family transcriptional regulator ligand-binding domain-containing protein [Nocardia sp. NPDC059246]|uniref:AraC family transcriptional regulator ligand-binding domain-containing protein n=1 Tax=unclassified Nocardia TaxID=2637762 RepID=UPI003690B57D